MVRIVWTEKATLGIEEIVDYIPPNNPEAATRISVRLVAAGESLGTFPMRGHEVRGGRRELSVVWPYIIRYRLADGTVYIASVRHGARPPLR